MNRKIFFSSVILITVFVLSSAFTGNLDIVRANTNAKSLPGQTRTDQWIENLQANNNNPEWYYLNLNSTDRLDIRLALDYAIPRTDIINTILNGFGTLLPTTDVPQTGMYYDNNIATRQYNPNKAVQLLTEVFGYTYNPTIDNPSTPYVETIPYFSMGFLVPNTSPTREQWASRILQEYTKIGIKTSETLLSFNQITSRVWDNNTGIGYDFAHGGYDGLFVGWTGSIIPNDGFFFYDSASMPYGNYQYVNSSYIDSQIKIEDTNHNLNARIQAYHNVQTYLNDQVIKNVLFQELSTYVMSNKLQGFNPFYARQGTVPYQMWNFGTGGKTKMVVAVAGAISNWNPLLSHAVYDNYYMSQIWAGGLLKVEDQLNDPTFNNYSFYNNFASWYNKSTDGLTYFFNLKQGLKWQDNQPITTTDVAYTYMAAESANLNTPYGPTLRRQINATFGWNNVTNGVPASTNLPSNGITVYNSTLIEFKLNQWDPLTMYNLFNLTVLPAHIYSKIPYANWLADPTNTGSGGFGSIIGSGPYQFDSYGTITGVLSAWSGWNAAYDKLVTTNYYNQSVGGSTVTGQIQTLPVHGVPVIQNVTVTIVSDPTTALAGLKAGNIDYAGSNIGFQNIYASVKGTSGITIDNETGGVWQELGLNQASPIWGYSPLDPWSSQLNYGAHQSIVIGTSSFNSSATSIASISNSTIVPTEILTHQTPGFEFYFPIILFLTLSAFIIRRRRKTQ